MKATAAAATTASGLSGVVSAGDCNYDVIEASNSNIYVNGGETFENKIIDFTNGNWATIVARGANWTIRNVGFRGTHDHDHSAMSVADDQGGSSLVEHIYLGDGCIRPDTYDSHGQVGIFVHRDHEGHVDIRDVNVQDWPNNGIYASAAAYDTPGSVTIDNSFGANNYVSSFRVSDYGEVLNSVAYNDSDGRFDGRPFWGWGDQDVIGCELDGGTYSDGDAVYGYDDSHTYLEDTTHTGYYMASGATYTEGPGVDVVSNGNTDRSIPCGIPTTPGEAACGHDHCDGGGSAGGEKPTVLEDFERTDPLADYGGRTGLYSVETSTVYEGSQAITNGGGDFGSISSTSGLGEYPDRGDEVHFYFNNAADDNFVASHFFTQSETDNPDSYSVGISSSSAWKIWIHSGGSVSELASASLPTGDQISGWYRAEVWTDASTIYAELYDDANDTLLASVSASDTTYSSGGIGFRSAGNGEVWDYERRGVVEDFERSSPLDEYGGATSLYSVETSTVFEGSQAITNASGSFGSISSTTGLRGYPERGEEFTVFFDNAADDNFVATHFFTQSETDNPDSYSAGISGTESAFKLWIHSGGSVSELASASLPTGDQISGWYRAEVWSDSTTVYADLYDHANDTLLASVSAGDTTYSSGGIGFRSGGNGEVWDYVVR